MGNSIEYMDSFEHGDSTRYSTNAMASFSSTGNHRGTNGSRCCQHNGGAAYLGVAVAAEDTKYQGVAFDMTGSPGSYGRWGLLWFAEGSTRHVTIMVDANGKVAAYRGTSTGGTLLGTSSVVCQVINSFIHYEAKVKVHDSTGTIDVWCEGTNVLSLSSQDTRNGGTGVIDNCGIGGDEGGGGGTSFSYYDDWTVQDASATVPVGDVAVILHQANATGTYSSATASTSTVLSCVDDTATNGDTDYAILDSTSLPKALSVNLANTPSNAVTVYAVHPFAIVRKDDAGANTGRLLLISGATESDGGADLTASTGYVVKRRIHNTDPNTGIAWTLSGVNAIEVGWRRIT